jgi:hypothetical protein
MSSQPTFSGSGAVPAASATSNNYIQPTLGHGLRIWWAFFWRNTGISYVVGALLAAGILFAAQLKHFQVDPRLFIFGGYVLEYFTAIFVVHYIVQKRFRSFRIILTPAGGGDSAQILPPIFKRTFRIWWTFVWRSVVYRVVLSVAMSVPLGVVTGAVAAISPQIGQVFTWITQVVISGAVGLFTIYSNILDEDIAGFRVSLAPRSTAVWPEEVLRVEPSRGVANSAVS